MLLPCLGGYQLIGCWTQMFSALLGCKGFNPEEISKQNNTCIPVVNGWWKIIFQQRGLRSLKLCKSWMILHINWCRIAPPSPVGRFTVWVGRLDHFQLCDLQVFRRRSVFFWTVGKTRIPEKLAFGRWDGVVVYAYLLLTCIPYPYQHTHTYNHIYIYIYTYIQFGRWYTKHLAAASCSAQISRPRKC